MKKKFSVLFFIVILNIGCSVDNKGIIDIGFYENSNCYLLKTESFGMHLSTEELSRSLIIGHYKVIYVYVKSGKKNNILIEDILNNIDDNNVIKEMMAADKEDFKKKQPFAIIERKKGISFDFNKIKVGVSLGVAFRSIFRPPMLDDKTVFFEYNNDKVSFFLNKKLK